MLYEKYLKKCLREKDDKMYYKEYYIMVFEWDEKKNQINLRKHGISFEGAVFVFNKEIYYGNN